MTLPLVQFCVEHNGFEAALEISFLVGIRIDYDP